MRERETAELQRLFGQSVEVIGYPSQDRDVRNIAAAADHSVAAVYATHFNNDQRRELVRALVHTPLLANIRTSEETRDRFGTKTTQQVWDGLGRVNERGEIEPLDDRALDVSVSTEETGAERRGPPGT